MKKLLIIITLAMLVGSDLTYAQVLNTETKNIYWYYRHRLHESFIIAGEEENMCVTSGLSLPASCARIDNNNSTQYELYWSDNPAQMLGYYIGMLATELKLLYLHDQPYDSTQQELCWAMKAYERLDYNCECLYYPKLDTTVGEINGLFCRDDVHPEVLVDESQGGLYQAWRDKNNYYHIVHSTIGDQFEVEEDPDTDFDDETMYPSGEEWAGLVTGFALLVKSLADCPEDVVVFNGYRFIDEAILHTQRYMDYFKADDWIGRLTTDEPFADAYDQKQFQCLYGLAKAADFICDPDRDYAVPLSIEPERSYADDFPYVVPAAAVWALVLNGLPLTAYNMCQYLFNNSTGNFMTDYQRYLWYIYGEPGSCLIAMCNVGDDVYEFLVNRNCTRDWICGDNGVFEKFDIDRNGNIWAATTPYHLAAIGDSWKNIIAGVATTNITYSSLRHYCDPMRWGFYPLLNLYLHDKQRNSADELRKGMINTLNSAPARGPHNHPDLVIDPSMGPPGWRTYYKWTQHYNRSYVHNSRLVEGNGIDFMLAYNLLWLEIIQNEGIENNYGISNYRDERLTPCNAKASVNSVVFWQYGDVVIDDLSSSIIDLYDHFFVASQGDITIQGDLDIGLGKTLDIQPYEMLTLPIVNGLIAE